MIILIQRHHKVNSTDIIGTLFFETPSIIFELSASNYLRENYDIDIHADELRKLHILSISREKSTSNNIFLTVMSLLKERKLNAVSL